jgi:hypothetical protein
MSGLTFNGTPSNISFTGLEMLPDWSFSPDHITIVYYQGSPMPAPVVVATRFKDVIGTVSAGNNIIFKRKTYLQHINNIPTVVAMSGALHTAGAFVPYANGVQGNITYSFSNLNVLNVGDFYAMAFFEIYGSRPSGLLNLLQRKTFEIKIKVLPAGAPYTDVENFEYTYYEDTPWVIQNRQFTITGDSWTVRCPPGFAMNASGMTVTPLPQGGYQITGTGAKTIQLVLLPSMQDIIDVNPYYTELVVNDGQLRVPIQITRLTAEGLLLERDELYFIAYKGLSNAIRQYIYIHYPGGFHFECPPWITINPLAGNNGNNYDLLPIAADNAEPGHYEGVLYVRRDSDNMLLGQVAIVYDVVGAIDSPYRPFTFAFTLDNQFINFVSEVDNAYFEVLITAKIYDFYSYDYKVHTLPFKVPLFQRKQELNFGKLLHRMMKSFTDFTENTNTNIPYYPAEISLNMVEKRSDDPEYRRELEINDLVFVAGINPGVIEGCGILDINPGPSRLTPSGYLHFNYLIGSFATIQYFKNDELVNEYGAYEGVKTARVDVSDYSVKPGDIFEIRMAIDDDRYKSKIYKIFPEGYYSNFIEWENEYKLKSAMEFTGSYDIKNDFDNRSQALVQRLVEVVKKLESNKSSKLTINTGYLLKTDIASVESLCRAPRAALLLDGRIINLVPVQKTLVSVESENELISFDVEFEINRQYNEEIYSF